MLFNLPLFLKKALTNRGIHFSLALKITALITISVFLVASVTTLIILEHNHLALKSRIKDELLTTATATALTLDTEQLKTLIALGDENSSAYKALQRHLQNVQKASHGRFKYLYVIARSGNDYRYILDATPIGLPDHSPIGRKFAVEHFPAARNGFEHPSVDPEPLYDAEVKIISQSGYAPVIGDSGNVLAMVGVDMDVTVLNQEKAKIAKAAGLALLASLLLALLLGVSFSRYITKPILTITRSTEKIMSGDFSQTVDVKRSDELGLLAQSFNSMTLGLRSSHESLQHANLELEAEIQRRTIELTRINREIRDILDHIDEIIFTMNIDFILFSQYSRKATELFGDRDFTDSNLLDVLFPDENLRTERENLASWLRLAYSDNQSMDWPALEALQPVTEWACPTANGKKHLRVNFRPIREKPSDDARETITRMMVIIQDLTDKHALQMAMEKKEQEYKDNINQIVEIIKLDQDFFRNFVTECQENIAAFEPRLIQLQNEPDNIELINDLFRIMHTIKGNASFFKLNRIAEAAHQFENTFADLQSGVKVLSDALLADLFTQLDRFNLLFNETMEISNRLLQGKQMDIGKTRSRQRTLEECETIRIRIEDLERIVELIDQAKGLITEKNKYIQDNQEIAVSIQNICCDVQNRLQVLRKVALNKLFARFPRMVHDISLELGKKTRLVMEGGDVELDKVIYEKVGDPIIHVLRNAVDHGIERPEVRVALGKPEEGVITLSAALSPSELRITVQDDGRGIETSAIKKKAYEKGLITAEQLGSLSDEEAGRLIFLPGFSTNDHITRVSGRGVGMDVVKTVIENELNGWIELESELNHGLTIVLHVPLMKRQHNTAK